MTEQKKVTGLVAWLGYLGITVLVLLPLSVLTVRSGVWQQGLLLYAVACLGAAVLLLLAALLPWGDEESDQTLRVGVLQANIDPYKKLDKSSLYEQVQTIKAACRRTEGPPVDLILGSEGLLRSRPEAPIVVNRLAANPAIKDLQEYAHTRKSALLLGFISMNFHQNNVG